MKGYKGSNKRMTKNYVIDISGQMKKRSKKLSLKKLSFDEITSRKGEIVFVSYPDNMMDMAVVYDADENGVTFWGSYDKNGDSIISMLPKSQYGSHGVAMIDTNTPPIKACPEILASLNFTDDLIKTVMEHIA